MPIVCFTHDSSAIPVGAANVRCTTQYGKNPIWLWDTHTGLCLAEREANGYHDSDFYMLVWDTEAQEPREICFASTRGWTYPAMGSHVDATPDIVAAYEAYCARQKAARRAADRKAMAAKRRAMRASTLAAGKAYGFPHWRLLRLRRQLPSSFDCVMALFSPRVRSKFKLSLQAQLVAWLRDDAPRYKTPFSPKQLTCLAK